MARCLAECETLLHCWCDDEQRSCYRGNPFAMLPEGQRCLRGLDDVLDLLHAHETMIYSSIVSWIPCCIFLLRFKDSVLETNGRRDDVV